MRSVCWCLTRTTWIILLVLNLKVKVIEFVWFIGIYSWISVISRHNFIVILNIWFRLWNFNFMIRIHHVLSAVQIILLQFNIYNSRLCFWRIFEHALRFLGWRMLSRRNYWCSFFLGNIRYARIRLLFYSAYNRKWLLRHFLLMDSSIWINSNYLRKSFLLILYLL